MARHAAQGSQRRWCACGAPDSRLAARGCSHQPSHPTDPRPPSHPHLPGDAKYKADAAKYFSASPDPQTQEVGQLKPLTAVMMAQASGPRGGGGLGVGVAMRMHVVLLQRTGLQPACSISFPLLLGPEMAHKAPRLLQTPGQTPGHSLPFPSSPPCPLQLDPDNGAYRTAAEKFFNQYLNGDIRHTDCGLAVPYHWCGRPTVVRAWGSAGSRASAPLVSAGVEQQLEPPAPTLTCALLPGCAACRGAMTHGNNVAALGMCYAKVTPRTALRHACPARMRNTSWVAVLAPHRHVECRPDSWLRCASPITATAGPQG